MSAHDADEENYSKTVFGFWVYLLTDFVMFATIFATYVVLQYGTNGGPSGRELFDLPFTLVQTLVLLFSSFTVGLAGSLAHRGERFKSIGCFALTFLLGMVFMGMEVVELNQLITLGHTWHKSAFLSVFFTLIGTHGIHMIFALLWIIVLIPPVWRSGLTAVSLKRLTCLRMFWQFLNIIWVLIFTIVYLMGVV